MWGGRIGNQFTAKTGYELGVNHMQVLGDRRPDSRGFSVGEDGFLRYTAQKNCILFFSANDTSGNVGDGFSVYTEDNGTKYWRIFRYIDFISGDDLGYSFQLPVKKGTVIVITFHVVKLKSLLDPNGGWQMKQAFGIRDIDDNPDDIEDIVTDRTWDYMCKLAVRDPSLPLDKYPINYFPVSDYSMNVIEMPFSDT